MAGAFDKIAKKSTTATKKATVKREASVNDDIKKKVDALIGVKAQIKQLEADKALFETDIIEHVRPQQDELAYNGTFENCLTVPGSEKSLLYITSDRFIVSQDEEPLAELRKVCGDKYDEFFTVKRVISVKEEIIKEESGERLKKIADAVQKAGLDIAEFFDVADKVVAQPNLDQNQYKLPRTKLASFRSLCRQFKPALKG